MTTPWMVRKARKGDSEMHGTSSGRYHPDSSYDGTCSWRNIKPHPSWYPDCRALDSGNEFNILLSKTGFHKIYSRIDWTWQPENYMLHFLRNARVLQWEMDVMKDMAIHYIPLGCRNPILITQKSMAKCLGLTLAGHFFDRASAEDVKGQKHLSMKTNPLSGEQNFSLASAKSEAVKIVARFAHNIIYLRKAPSRRVSLECMRHLQYALEGDRVAWAKILWENLLTRFMDYQRHLKRMKNKHSDFADLHFSVVVVTILVHLDYRNNDDLRDWWKILKSEMPVKTHIKSTSHTCSIKPTWVSNDNQKSDGCKTEDSMTLSSFMLDKDRTESETTRINKGSATVDHLATQKEELKLTNLLDNFELPGKDRLTSQPQLELQDEKDKLPLEKSHTSQDQSGHGDIQREVIAVDNVTHHNEVLKVEKRFTQIQSEVGMAECHDGNLRELHRLNVNDVKNVEAPSRNHELQFMLSNIDPLKDFKEFQARGSASDDSLSERKYVAKHISPWLQARRNSALRHREIMRVLSDNKFISPKRILEEDLDPVDNHVWKVWSDPPLAIDQNPASEFENLLQIQNSDEGKAQTAHDDRQQMTTQDLLQSLEFSTKKTQETITIDDSAPPGLNPETIMTQDSGPAGLNQPSNFETLQETLQFQTSFSLDYRLTETETKGADTKKGVEDTSMVRISTSKNNRTESMIASDDVTAISNLVKEQENLILNLTENATELIEYGWGEKKIFSTLSDHVKHKDLSGDPDMSEAQLKIEQEKNAELKEEISILRRERNDMEHEHMFTKTMISEQLEEHKQKVANLTNENSALKRKLKCIEDSEDTSTEKAKIKTNCSSVSNVLKRLKMSLKMPF